MESKEKAKELIEKYYKLTGFPISSSNGWIIKQMAYACAESHIYSENDSPFDTMEAWKRDNKFWTEVKQEIEKL